MQPCKRRSRTCLLPISPCPCRPSERATGLQLLAVYPSDKARADSIEGPHDRDPTNDRNCPVARSQEGYKYGFVTDIEADCAPPGLNEDTVRFISAKKEEPEWLLEWRLRPSAPGSKMTRAELGQADYRADRLPGRYLLLRAEAERPGRNRSTRSIRSCCGPTRSSASRLREREALAGVAVDAVFDSISVATTFKEELAKLGIIFCSMCEAVREHPELVRRYLGTRRAAERQFLRGAEFGGVQRRLVRLHPARRALPDGAHHLFPDQCAKNAASSSAPC